MKFKASLVKEEKDNALSYSISSRPVTEGRHIPLTQKGVENLVRVSRWRDTREEPECHREKRRQDMVERLQRTSTKDHERWGR